MIRTKIIATVGPACATTTILHRMASEGASVFRLNFSHGTLADHERTLEHIRKVQRHSSRPIAVLQDLAGPRIRTGSLQGHRPVQLVRGQRFLLHKATIMGNERGVSLDYAGRLGRIQPPQMIYVSDGNIHLKVTRSSEDHLETIVTQEGVLGERKGVNIPGAHLEFPSISQKDLEDLRFTIRHRLDYVAQSFVRSALDVLEIKRRIGGRSRVIAKIESREGVKNLAPILRAADGLMVARGDLGISVPIYELPILQKWMIAACNHFKKPVITATQMLEHMVEYPFPTRAEVSDVANAVIDGSDFVMLSGETAMGRYPVEAVKMMRTIIQYTERHAPYRGVRRTRS